MNRKVTADEMRSFLMASDRQFTQGGIRVSRVRFKRDEQGKTTLRRVQYEDRQNDPAEALKDQKTGLKPSDKGKG